MNKKIGFTLGFLCSIFLTISWNTNLTPRNDESWAQSTLEKMSLDEKIGQLFLIAAYVDPDYARKEIGNERIIQDIDHFITQYHVGGLAYVGPSEYVKQVVLTNHYQDISKYPLLIAQDLEWGLTMRIKDGIRFPKNITLGAIKDNQLIYEMGREIGKQAQLIGVHMNLSPVLDVNINPENIAINVRSFGDSPQQVVEKGIAMIQGLQEAGIIASAKHFPGLGDISIDPHLGLPYSSHDRKRLDEVELYPFIQAIKAGVLSIQTEHLIIPTLEPDMKTPSSLSPKVVDGLLKKEMGFKGLILSGALRMKALTNTFPENEIVLKAFLAGHDMLLMPEDFPKAHQTLKFALEQGKITEKEVDNRVMKILQLKEKLKLHCQSSVKVPKMEELHSQHAKELKKRLYQNAVTVLRNEQHLIPVSLPKKSPVAYVQIGESPTSSFLTLLKNKLSVDTYVLPLEYDDTKGIQTLLNQLDTYSLIILAIYPADPRRIEQIRLLQGNKQKEELKHFRVHGLSETAVQLINTLQAYDKKTILAYFGNPFGLDFFDKYSTCIMGFEDDPDAEYAAVSTLFYP